MRSSRYGAVAVVAAVTAAIAVSGRAAAAPGVFYGYVRADQPTTATYPVTSGYQHNSTGGAVVVERTSTGTYAVRFEGMTPEPSASGVAHAGAYGTGENGFCTVPDHGAKGKDVVVQVRCFDAQGSPAALPFVANYTNAKPVTAAMSYLWASNPTTIDPYLPPATHRHESAGAAANIVNAPFFDGAHRIYSPTVDGQGHPAGAFMQVTPRSAAARHCQSHGTEDSASLPISVLVVCRDADGVQVDTPFTFSYTNGMDLLGTGLKAARGGNALLSYNAAGAVLAGWWSVGGQPTVYRTGTGRFRVTFPGLSSARGHAVANAAGSAGQHYCTIAGWHPAPKGNTEVVSVDCFDTFTGQPADSMVWVGFVTV